MGKTASAFSCDCWPTERGKIQLIEPVCRREGCNCIAETTDDPYKDHRRVDTGKYPICLY